MGGERGIKGTIVFTWVHEKKGKLVLYRGERSAGGRGLYKGTIRSREWVRSYRFEGQKIYIADKRVTRKVKGGRYSTRVRYLKTQDP